MNVSITILELKDLIINSTVYKDAAEFVKEILATAVEKRKRKFELETKRLDNELREILSDLIEPSNFRRKYTLPKLQFIQFGDDLKDWLPFWGQFQHIDKDEEKTPENKLSRLSKQCY
ncbi:endonuclease [Caerostris extrusa]|uniref:Endonuclease n=1 Tax=Caerostris extrusa TaxID=172846 RepID=A0AAV4PPI9_CAEEX|nr:endonuclease [Caerostris extrusa]